MTQLMERKPTHLSRVQLVRGALESIQRLVVDAPYAGVVDREFVRLLDEALKDNTVESYQAIFDWLEVQREKHPDLDKWAREPVRSGDVQAVG